MLDKLTTLLTPEWWKLIKPKQLPAYAIRSIRVALDRMADIEHICTTTYTPRATRARYTVLDIPIERIVPNQYRAGDSVNVLTVSGAGKDSDWKYYIDSMPPGLTIIGTCTSDRCMMRGADFKECATGYLFKTNPAEHSTIIHRGKGVRCVFLAVGGPLRVMHRPQDAIYTGTATDPIAVRAIVNAVTAATVTGGVSGTTANATRAVGVPVQTDTVYRVWTENLHDFLQLSCGEVYAAQDTRKPTVTVQSDMRKGEQWTSADQRVPEIFYFPYNGKYAAGTVDAMSITDFPDIQSEYSGLQVRSGQFQGSELIKLLQKRGCNPFNVWYGISDSGTQQALGHYLVQDGTQLMQQCITATDTLSVNELKDRGTVGVFAHASAETLSITDSAIIQFIV